MSQGIVRRADKQMSQAEMEEFLGQAAYGHFGTVSANGDPYVVPNLFVYHEGRVYTHNASVAGHFRQNIQRHPRLCFEASAMGQVWPYGEFECDTTVSYTSVICFGSLSVESDPAAKAQFFDLFMAKYARPDWERPKSFYPRLEQVTVYALTIEQMTGKKGPLPGLSEQWPAVNKTLSPRAVAPAPANGQ